MFKSAIPLLLSLTLLGACRENPNKEVREEAADPGSDTGTAPAMGETRTVRQYCYVSRTPTPEAFGDTYNYQFIRFEVGENGDAVGTVLYAPYGTDGTRGSISGVYREGEQILQSTTTYLAEGALYEEPRDYKIGERGLSFLHADKQPTETIPAVTCQEYEKYLEEYQGSILKNRVNTTDRTRLKKVQEVRDFGYAEEQIDQLRFMELRVELDNDYQTEEYLLYLMDPMVCGSGGCNLLVIDGNGRTRSRTTVVKLPIYAPASIAGDTAAQGEWQPLYVWSQGFRKLEAKDGQYPSNASMAPEVPEEEITGHPEKYRLILDHWD